MATLLIGYDLNRPVQNYAELIEKIKTYGLWWHCLDSTWLIKTTLTAAQVRDELMRLIDQNDELLVIDVTGRMWAAYGFDKQCGDWLANNI